MSDTNLYPPGDHSYLDRAYALKSPTEARTLYDEWAKSYDTDLSALDYAFPRHAVEAILTYLPEPSGDTGDSTGTSRTIKVLDAGCGTGLVGVALTQAALTSDKDLIFDITGIDISPSMLAIAQKTTLYTTLTEVDLTQPLTYASSSYDVVVCVGTLTRGHVGYKVLSEFLRVVRSGGLIVATVLGAIWESGGFEAEIGRLEKERMVEVLRTEKVGVVEGGEKGGRLMVLRKI